MKIKLLLYFSIFLLLCGLAATLYTYDRSSLASNIGLISILLGTTGSILSLFIPKQYTKVIKANDWIEIDGELIFVINYRKHGIKDPKAAFYMETEKGFEEALIDFSFENNNVIAKVGRKYNGKIIVH